ncbi:hypothetical protein AOQ84DRAFT_77696 [Glonium stellatum]|uniref:Uncharacterized protein n=1 Tax=Glonium stellatum TaxID=574774 RepID=A0A8E2JR18_9PEZI|nr:hypothetical protein AOQ84DRAFT_77696 [Glonium stellatum]
METCAPTKAFQTAPASPASNAPTSVKQPLTTAAHSPHQKYAFSRLGAEAPRLPSSRHHPQPQPRSLTPISSPVKPCLLSYPRASRSLRASTAWRTLTRQAASTTLARTGCRKALTIRSTRALRLGLQLMCPTTRR